MKYSHHIVPYNSYLVIYGTLRACCERAMSTEVAIAVFVLRPKPVGRLLPYARVRHVVLCASPVPRPSPPSAPWALTRACAFLWTQTWLLCAYIVLASFPGLLRGRERAISFVVLAESRGKLAMWVELD